MNSSSSIYMQSESSVLKGIFVVDGDENGEEEGEEEGEYDENDEETSDNECNLNKLIKNLTKNRLFTINDSDRVEIITKAYNVIMGTDDDDNDDADEETGQLTSNETISDLKKRSKYIKYFLFYQ